MQRIPKLAASGPPAGCSAGANYPTVEVQLLFPAELYLFSDGVFETRRQQETASLARLVDFLVRPSDRQGPTLDEVRNRTLEHSRAHPYRRLLSIESVGLLA